MAHACHSLFPIDSIEEFRQMSHKKLDEWIDTLDAKFAENPSPTMKDLSNLFQETRSQFMSACMQAAINRLYPSYIEQEWADCPLCGKAVHRKRFESKKISTMQGIFTLDRPYFYCKDCKQGFYPLDEVMEIAPQRHQHDIQERVTTTAARMPFEETSKVFRELTSIPLGDHFSHKTLNAVGEQATLECVIPEGAFPIRPEIFSEPFSSFAELSYSFGTRDQKYHYT